MSITRRNIPKLRTGACILLNALIISSIPIKFNYDRISLYMLLLSGNGNDDCFLALNHFRKTQRQLGIYSNSLTKTLRNSAHHLCL